MSKAHMLTGVLALAAAVLAGGECLADSTAAERGAVYLESRQGSDGTWSENGKRLVDSAEAFYSLWYLGRSGARLEQCLDWAMDFQADDTLRLARRLTILAKSDFDVVPVAAKLAGLQNPDGGFGSTKERKGQAYLTALACRALVESGSKAAAEKALGWLAANQRADGSWALLGDSSVYEEDSELFLTASILSMARQYQVDNGYYATAVSAMVGKASAFLVACQAQDGSWGGVTDTAAAIAALIRTSRPQSLVTAVGWLEGKQSADGSFEGNVYRTALAIRALRDWEHSPVPLPPDLALAAADISFAPAEPSAADQILFTVKVRNIGASVASNVGVWLYDGDPADSGRRVGPDIRLADIAPGKSGTARVGLYLPAGARQIHVVADPDKSVIESDEANNAAFVGLTVNPTLLSPADLAVAETDISFATPDVSCPNRVVIKAVVHNRGETVAGNVVLRVLAGDAQLGGDFTLDKVFGLGQYLFQLDTTLKPGINVVTVKVDPNNQVAESEEDNNVAQSSITVANLAPAAPAGLAVEAGDASAVLTWTWSQEPDILGYNLYRAGAKVNASPILVPGYRDAGLVNGTTYVYKATAVDLYGAEGAYSSEVSVTPQTTVVNRPSLCSPASPQTVASLDSDRATIEGAATAGDAVEIYVNGQLRASATTGAGSAMISVAAQPEWTAGGTNVNTDVSSAAGDLKLATGVLSGQYRRVFDAGAPRVWGRMVWNAALPAGTSVKFRTRSASSEAGLAVAVWSEAVAVSPFGISSKSAQFLEVEIALASSSPTATPVVNDYAFGCPEGAFSIANVALDDGFNVVKAVAVRGAARGAESDPATINVSLGVDLAVTDLSASPDAPTADQPVKLMANVRNIGLGAARDFKVKFYDGDPASGGKALGEGFVIPILGPGSSANLTVEAYLDSGAHAVYVVADTANAVPESDEANNRLYIIVNVAAAQATPPDFALTALTISNAAPSNTDAVTLAATVKNLGGSRADLLELAFYKGDPANGERLGDKLTLNNLQPQGVATISLKTMLEPGAYQIFAVADPDNNVTEQNEGNNQASVAVAVSESPNAPADLVVDAAKITFSNAAPLSTDVIDIGATVTNAGGVNAADVEVRFYDGDPAQGGQQLGSGLKFAGIAAGGEGKATLKTALSAGTHRIYVVADPANTIGESDEDNNKARADLTVEQGPPPDLSIAPSEIVVVDTDITSGDLVKIKVVVRNLGAGPANQVSVRLYQGAPLAGGFRTSMDIPVAALAPSDSATVEIGWGAAVGDRDLYVVADPENIIPEDDEDNNIASLRLHVGPYEPPSHVTDPEILAAIDNGVAWLKTQQQSDGSFVVDGRYSYGSTALALLAFLHGGLTEDDPVVAKGFTCLSNYNGNINEWYWSTYSVALAIMSYQATGNKEKYRTRVESLTNQLVNMYYGSNGLFSYGDMSNSQYGYIALYAASQWGIAIPDHIKTQGLSRMTSGQNQDGGWNYDCWSYGGSYGSMTSAGLVITRILGLTSQDTLPRNAIEWLNNHYTMSTNPGYGGYHYYYLYGLERAMSIPTPIKLIGGHDWYKDGAAVLLSQQQSSGYWVDTSGPIIDTSFALLFLERAVPEVSTADLLVDGVKFSDSQPSQGDSVVMTATIKNQGLKNITAPFKVSFYDGDPLDGGTKIGADQTVATLNGPGTTDVSVAWTVSASGEHHVYVVADSYNAVEESDETNNVGIATLATLTQDGFQIVVATDKGSYNPTERVTATVTVTNVGQTTASGVSPVSIQDADGQLIKQLAPEYLPDLAAGASHTFTRTWDVPADAIPGAYRAAAAVMVGETKKAANHASFAVAALYGLSSKILPDHQAYNHHSDVRLDSRVKSETSNHPYSELRVSVKITAPGGAEAFSLDYTVAELVPGALDAKNLLWNTSDFAPGDYLVTQQVRHASETTVLCESSATLTILSSLVTGGFAGSISATPNPVEGPAAFTISYEITNSGNTDIAGAELLKIVNARQVGANALEFPEPLDLAKGATHSGTVDNVSSANLSIGSYMLVLQLKTDDGKTHPVATRYLTVVDTVAPVIADLTPANGTLGANATPALGATLTDNFSGVDTAAIELAIDGAPYVASFDTATGRMLSVPLFPLADGWHQLTLSIKDKAGNPATAPEWKIGIDTTAPTIADFAPVNGSLLADSAPAIRAVLGDNFSGVDPSSVILILDGSVLSSTFADGVVTATPASPLADGWHELALTVKDKVGNQAASPVWKFAVDTKGPDYAGLTPANSTVSNNASPTLAATVSDSFSGVDPASIVITLDGITLAASFDVATGHISATSDTPLADGWHVAVLTAKDMLGNASTGPEWKFGVDTAAPVIADLFPANGGLGSNPQPVVSATLSDSFSGVDPASLVLTLDGAALVASYDPATGKVAAVPASALADGWHSLVLTAKDLVGNQATSTEWRFAVDTTPPVIAILSPANGAATNDATPALSASVADAISGVDPASLILTLDGTAIAATFANGVATANVASPLADGWHVAVLTAKDMLGNASTGPEWKFGVDSVAPVIANSSPANDSIGQAQQPVVSATLSDAFSGVDPASLCMTLDGTALVASYDPATGKVAAVPASALADGWHDVVVTAADLVGNQGSNGWRFGVDTTPPTITALTPATGATVNESQPTLSAILADSFSGVDSSSIELKLNGVAVPFTYDAATGKVAGAPAAPVQDGDYEVTLAVKDMAGNQASAASWQVKVRTWLIFHNSSSGEIQITGSGKQINGRVHSNAKIKISGSNNCVNGLVSAVGTIKVTGSNNNLGSTQPGAAAQPIPVYVLDYYRQHATYTHNGNWQVSGSNVTLPAGVHFVNGSVHLSGSRIFGDVTIVATGRVQVSGSNITLRDADGANRLLLFSGSGDIDVTGSSGNYRGLLYGPGGACHLTGSGDTFAGAVIGDTVQLTGSNKTFGNIQ